MVTCARLLYSRSYVIVTDNLTKVFQLNCFIINLTKLFFAKVYKRICPLLLTNYWYRLLYQFSAICQRDLCNIRLLLSWGGASIFQFPTSPPFCSHPLPCCEAAPHIQLSGERRKLSRVGVQTDNALCTRKTSYRTRVYTSRVFNRSQGQRGLLLEVLRYNVNVNAKT